MRMTSRLSLGTLAVVVLAATVATITYIWNRGNTDSGIIAVAPLDPSCDLQQRACQALFPDGSRVTLTVIPRPVQALKSFQIRVLAEGVDPEAVEVDFRGLGMSMGYNRPRLNKESTGTYSGSGMLSMCTMERMPWEATVLVRTHEGIMAAPFRFETIRP